MTRFHHTSTYLTHRLHTLGTSLIFVLFFMVSVFGILVCNGLFHPGMDTSEMSAGSVGTTGNCSLLLENSCAMSVIDHINHWNNTFTKEWSLSLGIMLATTFIIITFFRSPDSSPGLSLDERYRSYARDHTEHRLYNILNILFSEGILQPKVDA